MLRARMGPSGLSSRASEMTRPDPLLKGSAMKREQYRLDGNPKRAIEAITGEIAKFGFRGVHWDFAVPIFELFGGDGPASRAVCNVEYHDDHTWRAAHAALQPVIGLPPRPSHGDVSAKG
jgi:hypothetical protein